MTPPSPLASRLDFIAPFHVMSLLEQARQLEQQGHDVIHMEIGEPDFGTPPAIIQTGMAALQAGHTGYSPALGLPALREAIAEDYARRFGVQVPARRIVITAGASGALLLALAALVSPGKEVLLSDPAYPCNRHFVHLLEGRAVNLPVGPDSQYQLTADHLAQHWSADTVAALVATPSNPTGTLLSAEALAALNTAALARGGRLIVDEIYQGLVYDQAAHTALAQSDQLFVINSFSKYFQMTGWRLGWLVVPEAYLDAVNRLAQNIFIAASTPAQHAALAAFQPDTLSLLEQRRLELKSRRDALLPMLQQLGFRINSQPQGAFYVYADSSTLAGDCEALSARLLQQAHVAITPGIDFGQHRAREHVRFAYTVPVPRLEQMAERLRKVL